jgi:hypothetical protein
MSIDNKIVHNNKLFSFEAIYYQNPLIETKRVEQSLGNLMYLREMIP